MTLAYEKHNINSLYTYVRSYYICYICFTNRLQILYEIRHNKTDDHILEKNVPKSHSLECLSWCCFFSTFHLSKIYFWPYLFYRRLCSKPFRTRIMNGTKRCNTQYFIICHKIPCAMFARDDKRSRKKIKDTNWPKTKRSL